MKIYFKETVKVIVYLKNEARQLAQKSGNTLLVSNIKVYDNPHENWRLYFEHHLNNKLPDTIFELIDEVIFVGTACGNKTTGLFYLENARATVSKNPNSSNTNSWTNVVINSDDLYSLGQMYAKIYPENMLEEKSFD